MSLLRLLAASMPPARPLLSEAVAAWRPGGVYYSGANDALVDLTRNGRNARFGSAVGSDTNDPVMLDYAGEPYLFIPSAAGNFASATTTSGNTITGDIDLRVRVRVPDRSGTRIIHARYASAHRGYVLWSTANRWRFAWYASATGSSDGVIETDAVAGPFDGWVRVTLIADNGAGGYEGRIFTAPPSERMPSLSEWTPAGPDVIGAAPTSIYASPARLAVGNDGGGFSSSYARSEVHRVQAWRGLEELGGEVVYDFNAADASEPDASWVSSTTGETWQVQRALTGYKATIVRRPTIMFDGVDDYLQVAHDPIFDLLDTTPLTAVVVMRDYATRVVSDVISKKNGSTADLNGWRGLRHSNGQLRAQWSDGTTTFTTTAPSVAPPEGETNVAAWVFKPGAGIWLYRDGVEVDAETSALIPGGHAFEPPLRMGAYGGGVAQAAGAIELFAAAVFRRELSGSEQLQVAAELGVNL